MKQKKNEKSILKGLASGLLKPWLRDRRFNLMLLISFFAVMLGLVALVHLDRMYPGVSLSDYEVGKVAERELTAEETYYYTDDEASRSRREAQAALVNPVFMVSEPIRQAVLARWRQFVLEWERLQEAGRESGEPPDYQGLIDSYREVLSEAELEQLASLEESGALLEKGEVILQTFLLEGIVMIPEELPAAVDTVELWRTVGGEKQREVKSLARVLTKKELPLAVESLPVFRQFSREEQALLLKLVTGFAEENAFYDHEQTEVNRRRARESVTPVVNEVNEGDVIVRKGFVVTEEDMEKIEALGTRQNRLNVRGILGSFLFLLLLYIGALTLLSPPLLKVRLDEVQRYFVLISAVLYILIVGVLWRLTADNLAAPLVFIVPTAFFTMLIAILVNTECGILVSLLLSLGLLLIPDQSLVDFTFAFTSGTTAVLAVRGAQKRFTIIRAGGVVALVHLLITVPAALLQGATLSAFWGLFGISVANALVCAVLALGLLPLLEHMLNVPTPFRLMELSDLNTPLFRRMLILAPGTYNHSISVANLAETACKEIGANALLARVGAYYHDIGKIDQSEYFVENQTAGNKHDDLKATLSTAVIKSHVKIGIEKAKELGLPKEVLDIISEHHGSGQISFFYIKALEEQGKNKKSKAEPEDFTYSGTPPVSKEAAVVMLADTVEAASRTLKKPTFAKMDRFVWDMILKRVTEGQMRNTELTFKDLIVIKNVFVRILAGSFHTRIEYPDQKRNNGEDDESDQAASGSTASGTTVPGKAAPHAAAEKEQDE